jgi:hypothetical protein
VVLQLALIMPLYNFRLRFNFAEGYRIDSDVEEIELLVSPLGERIRLRSGAIGTPIKDHNQAAVLGGPYTLKDQARVAAEKSKCALLYWAIDQRLGIDFGDGKQRSGFTKAGLAMLQKQQGCPVRNDVHGIDVYEHVEKLKFVRGDVKATVGKSPLRLIDTFQREYLHTRHLTEKQVLASEIYASSFFDISSRSRFITLVTAVEALLERPKRPGVVEELVKEFKAKTQLSNVNEQTKKSIIDSLGDLKRESITKAGRTLAGRLIPNELFDGQSSANFFTRCYKLRSQILHRGKAEDGLVDILDLANVMEGFVAKLLLAALHSVPRQDTGADDDN